MVNEKTLTVTLKVPNDSVERISKLVKNTGITRHNLLLRLVNLGLTQAESDVTALLSPAARPIEDQE